jgi:hypothetical protein
MSTYVGKSGLQLDLCHSLLVEFRQQQKNDSSLPM